MAVPIVRIKLVDELPGGKVVLPLEKEGDLAFLMLRSEMTERGAVQLTKLMQYEVDAGRWSQNWPDRQTGPTGTSEGQPKGSEAA